MSVRKHLNIYDATAARRYVQRRTSTEGKTKCTVHDLTFHLRARARALVFVIYLFLFLAQSVGLRCRTLLEFDVAECFSSETPLKKSFWFLVLYGSAEHGGFENHWFTLKRLVLIQASRRAAVSFSTTVRTYV